MYLVFRHDIAQRLTAFDGQIGKADVELEHFQAGLFLQRHAESFRLAVRIGREPPDFRPLLALHHVVFLVAGDARYGKTFHVGSSALAVLVDEVIDSTLVVALEHVEIQHILAHIQFVGHFHHLILSVLEENDNIVHIRTVAHKLVLLQSRTDKAVLAVDIQLFVGFRHFRCLDVVETADFGAARIGSTVFLLQFFVPGNCIVDERSQMMVDFLHLFFQRLDIIVGLFAVETQDTSHLNFQQAENVVARDFTHKISLIGGQALVDMSHSHIEVRTLFVFFILVNPFFDEDFLQRSVKQAFHQFAALYFQLAAQQFLRIVDTTAQHVAHLEEQRLLFGNHTAVGRNADFTVGKRIERVDGTVTRRARNQMHDNVGMFRGIVVHTAHLDFSLFLRLDYRLDKRSGCFSEWDVGNFQRFIVDFFNLGTHAHRTAALAVVVLRHVDIASRREIGIERKLFATQIGNGCIQQFVEVMGKDFRRKSDCDTFGTLHQKQRELHRQNQRFRLSSVVGHCPLRRFRIEHRFQRKFRQTCFDVTGSSGTVSRKNVTPVTLAFHKQILLSELHERIADGSVTVRVILHRMSHDVRHLVETSVVGFLHRMQNTPLHRLQSVEDMRHGTFENHIRSVVEKPVLVHSRQVHIFFFRHLIR